MGIETVINQAIEALTMAHDYINDGSLLPQDMNDPYFKTDAAIDMALHELKALDEHYIKIEELKNYVHKAIDKMIKELKQ